jgi:hypothetical protein
MLIAGVLHATVSVLLLQQRTERSYAECQQHSAQCAQALWYTHDTAAIAAAQQLVELVGSVSHECILHQT